MAVGAAIGGAILGNSATNKATKATSKATKDSLAEQARQFDLIRSDQEPFREAGVSALTQLQDEIGKFNTNLPSFNKGEDFKFNLEDDKGFNFARDEAIKATNREAAALGGFNSGNRLAEIGDRVTGIASQFANDAFNRQIGESRENFGRNLTQFNADTSRNQDLFSRRQNFLNRLSSIAGIGQSSLSETGAAGQNFANATSNIRGSNAVNQGNLAIAQGQNLNNALQGGISNFMLANQTKTPTRFTPSSRLSAQSVRGV